MQSVKKHEKCFKFFAFVNENLKTLDNISVGSSSPEGTGACAQGCDLQANVRPRSKRFTRVLSIGLDSYKASRSQFILPQFRMKNWL